ncbi:ABC transporter permease [Candidatus Izimaplasma bacterium]|nr:ABC transporter permease [Candidatus Izimaplasma bacterium]
MKNRLWILIKGELVRLNKYGVFSISILVAFIWGVVLFLVSDDILGTMLPFVLFLDATLMSVMYIGAEMHFEKSESTISTMLVTPVTNNELVLSKVLANLIHNLTASLLIIAVFFAAGKLEFINEVGFSLILLILGIVLVTATFTITGLVLSYYQKDFTGMLVNMFIMAIFLMIPAVLLMFGVLEGEFWENAMLANPLYAAQNVIGGGFHNQAGELDLGYEYFVSLGYMLLGGIGMFFFLAIPKFQDYAVRQSGV